MREGAAEGRPDGSHGVDADGGAAEDTAAGRPSANPTHRRERGWGCWAAPRLGTGSPGHREEAEDEGVLRVPGAEEENILCKERGGAGARGAGGVPSRAAGAGCHSPSWSKCVWVPCGPGMEHTRRALRNVLQRLMRLRFPPTSFCRATRAAPSPAPPTHPHGCPRSGTPETPAVTAPALLLAPLWGARGWEGVWGAAEWGRGLGVFSLPCSKAQAEVGTRLLLTKPARGG